MKKAVSTLLCICFLVLSSHSIALAVFSESLVFTETIEDSWIVDVTSDGDMCLSQMSEKTYYQRNSEYTIDYVSYSQLDEAQKVIYNAVMANPCKLSFTIYFDDGVFAYENFAKSYFTEVMNAICFDRPDLFYFAGYNVQGGSLYSNNQFIASINYVVGVYDSTIYDETNLPGYREALLAKLEQIPVDTTNRFLFIESVHDYLANNIYYPDLSTSDYVMSAHDAYGALVEGRAVCQGYSDAMKLICDYYNIPCICISGVTDSGGGHMWNGVQMDDGLWYLMDVTWDDQDSRIFYDFFLVGTESTNTYFGGSKFSSQHINDTDIYLPNLQFALTEYDTTQNHFSLFGATYNSYYNESMGFVSLSVYDAGNSRVYYNGMDTGAEASQGYEFSVVDSDGDTRNCTVVIVCDPDSDGNLTDNDYTIAKNYAVGDSNAVDSIASAACDVNCDGCVDAIDLAMIARAKSGLNTEL